MTQVTLDFFPGAVNADWKEESRPVEMMWQKANFNYIYISEAQTQVLELPYAGKELSMIILLPDEDVDLRVVENSLTFEKFIDWTEAASLQNIEVKVFIPRFKLQGDYVMEPVLQRLGMVDVFQEGQADLSAMSTETDLCLSKFVHKSVLEVNEEGTEAEESRPVEMMWQKANFNYIYISEAQTQVLELPYAGKELSMIILLPDEDVDLRVVENSLTFEKFIDWTEAASLQNIEVKVFIPRFKLQGDYVMEPVLQRLGMVDVFQEGQADLSAMSTETDLCLSKFVHKSVLEVNEEGTEAVAGSDIHDMDDCFSYLPYFTADHPFLFFIRHNETNTLLFCGRFSSP
ncbi:Hypothetical predicted protein [Marmota monax]|uniref:Serpin domain-containing protein n=1 Tax=Marmota monax TaxID=9995 RepID=A0A5E4AIC4_MARMO|nr:Hypothetical predicted protein [Marmota monax]